MIDKIRVIIADDNSIVRMGLEQLLATTESIEVVASVENGALAVEAVETLKPDLCLLDVRMPVMNGIEAVSVISQQCKVLMLTHSEDAENVTAAMHGGAAGYVIYSELDAGYIQHTISSVMGGVTVVSPSASTALLNSAGPTVQDGGNAQELTAEPQQPANTDSVAAKYTLSRREAEVMGLVADGLSNREIAERFFLSEKTVKNHINRIFTKMDVSSRAEAVSIWLKESWA